MLSTPKSRTSMPCASQPTWILSRALRFRWCCLPSTRHRRARPACRRDCAGMGAGSGIGVIAIQVAKLLGGVGDCHCRKRVDGRREPGRQPVGTPRPAGDAAQAVKQFTAGRGVEVVFEHPGEATWERSLASLAWGGRLVICGNTTGYLPRLTCASCSTSSSTCWAPTRAQAGVLQALKFVESGQIKPVVLADLPTRGRRPGAGDHVRRGAFWQAGTGAIMVDTMMESEIRLFESCPAHPRRALQSGQGALRASAGDAGASARGFATKSTTPWSCCSTRR